MVGCRHILPGITKESKQRETYLGAADSQQGSSGLFRTQKWTSFLPTTARHHTEEVGKW